MDSECDSALSTAAAAASASGFYQQEDSEQYAAHPGLSLSTFTQTEHIQEQPVFLTRCVGTQCSPLWLFVELQPLSPAEGDVCKTVGRSQVSCYTL